MLPVGERYETERGTTLEITFREGDRMSFERSYAPDTGHADPHLHQDLIQTWEALEGEGMIEVDGEERRFAAGDKIGLTPGTGHRDPWNPGDGGLRVRGSFDPCNDFIEAYAEAWAHGMRNGKVNSQDEMPLMQIVAISADTDGRSFSTRVPVWLQRATAPVIKAFARLRGYRSSYGGPP